VVVPEDVDVRASHITVLLEGGDGTIWCGTLKGLYKLEQSGRYPTLRSIDVGMPHDYPEQHYVADVLEDTRGSLWIATASGLYRRWPDGSSARYTQREGLPNSDISDLLEDRQGQLWVGTRLGGFFRVAVDNSHARPVIAQTFTTEDGLPANWIFQLFEDSSHQLWIATANGLAEFFPNGDEHGHRFHSYSESNGLSYHDLTALNEDLGGNLWLGTNAAGAMKFARDGFVTYDPQDGLWWAGAVFQDRTGAVCFRGEVLGDRQTSVFEGARVDVLNPNQGIRHMRLGRFDGEHFAWFKPDAIVDFGWVLEQVTLQTRDREWWVGTNAGLFRFAASNDFREIKNARPLAVYTVKDGLASQQIFRLFEDSHGNIWISTISATMNGLAIWERSDGKLRDLTTLAGLPSLKDDLARSFGEDRNGQVWIGFDNGLARYADGKFKFFTASDGLPSGAIKNIYPDPAGRLWLASARGGLIRIDDPQAERPTFNAYTTSQGLSSNSLEVITGDAAGHIYVGGGNGLDRLDPDTGRIKQFTTADGLAPGLFRTAFCDRNGVLWLGMTRGLSRFAPAPDKPIESPAILITGLRVGGSPRHVSALGEKEITLPDLSANDNQLQLDFVSLNFRAGEVLRYQYKLEGAAAGWSALNEQRTVNYANLAPGRYRFLVRAIYSNGNFSKVPASVTFTILRPFWQRWWFLALGALLSLAVGYALYRYRISRLLEVANMRTRIATDLHDDIGANLTKIAILSEVIRQQSGNSDAEADSPLSSIARISRDSVASMSDIVWAINPNRDSLLDLVRRMRRHAEEIFTTRDIALEFRAPGADDHLKLGVDVRRDLFLIFKEAVNNVARHSRCSHVEIDFRAEDSELLLQVSDNGAGFDTTRESEGEGLMSMSRRARAGGGSLEIESRSGGGTTIKCRVPLGRPRRAR
jgi:signal transduction histidine kinase/ligand-binding sensor domain-containing protein